jgi:5-methyltetrahydrofolate--homocysteine methyltransferase
MTSPFLEEIRAGKVWIADGATGTNLQRRGLPPGQPGEVFVLQNPAAIEELAQEFIAAGGQIILTCTFGGNRLRLRRAGLEGELLTINQRAVELARRAARGSPVLIGGSMGPSGEMMQPYGTLGEEEVRQSFAEQARILSESGVDLLVLETFYDLSEARAAVEGVRSVSDLPLVLSFSFDRGRKTMMGVSPTRMAEAVTDWAVDVLGINCGRSLEDNLANLRELRAVTPLPIWFKPNAGLPVSDERGGLSYTVHPQDMAEALPAWLEGGAQVIGGCCGTSPEHLRAIADAVHRLRA